MRALFIAPLGLLLVASSAGADPRVHVVRAGDSLEVLARRYGTSVETLRELNDLRGDVIRVGQELTLEDGGTIRYTTIPGDTLGCIAERYGVPAERIRADNASLARGRLEVGRRLLLRGARAPRGAARVDVARGETLGEVAARLGVAERDLMQANEGVDPDRLPRELAVPVLESVHHEVQPGESFARIASRHEVTVDALSRWNPGVDPRRLRVGARLVVGRGAVSASVGSPTCGSIDSGVRVAPHRGFVLRDRARAWASERTASRLASAFDALVRAHPRAARVRVHDLSLRGGGPIDDHRSHQSGRDVDLTYYQRRACEAQGCPLRELQPEELDVPRQWTLLRHWLRSGDAELIFVDYSLQAPLHREARRRGASAEELDRWFQYPRGRSHRGGVIRHFPNHRDHVHVRFACARGESRCR